ncbi:DedA family protein [Bogoriella caseilytica]|uniref:Membrane protein DedA with SNARE-associated domain n=1 Tax=Bogoriella caseilytica TaxID=56055 RepID=A0A3N2BFW1_9MICO|nr:VTT domain-containing protein [Bogoriella caseilytica]ROR74108.1 membrane protein DedA with SNARE-associated domain [Bogoriella caseilytica]
MIPDDSSPFWVLFIVFYCVGFFRTLATYWIARVVSRWTLQRTGPQRPWVARVQTWLDSDTADKGVAVVRRWGVPAVPLSFLLTGTKTVVNAAAGVLRMPMSRYLPALAIGSAGYAVIYATIGWGAWVAVVAAAAGSPWAIGAIAGAVLAAVSVIILKRRTKRRDTSSDEEGATIEG